MEITLFGINKKENTSIVSLKSIEGEEGTLY